MVTDRNTIFAPATASGRAGVSVLRISGPDVGRVVELMAAKPLQPRYATLQLLRDPSTADPIDRALLVYFPAPQSFTGEDVLEIHCHGSRAVVARLLEVLGSIGGLRLAEPGEFARRAFENGKLDLTAVEGLADLINAETDAQRRQALRQSEGALGALYETWRSELIAAAALIEAMLDFSDEDQIGDELYGEAFARVSALKTSIAQHLDDAHRGERLRDGFQVVIAGAPNVGKSSLLNALAQRDAAIISSEAGTTRDVIEVRLDLGGYPITLMDTAGIRAASGAVEKEGIRRTLMRASEADLVLWLDDGLAREENDIVLETLLLDNAPRQIWKILSKADRLTVDERETMFRTGSYDLAISSTTSDGLTELISKLQNQLVDGRPINDAPLITRARHRQEIKAAAVALEAFLAGSASDPELRAEDLRQAVVSLGRLTGRIDVEELLGRIFSEFCIGK